MAVTDLENPSYFENCDNCPVERVSWYDIVNEFLPRLNAMFAKGYNFRLPTEAEWEYAARAGTTTPFSFGTSLSTDQDNFNGSFPYGSDPAGIYRERTTPIKSFASNDWGLYDMHWNVYEWCYDWHGLYEFESATEPLADPTGPSSGFLRVMRSGSWANPAQHSRSANRGAYDPGYRNYRVGFRLVFSLFGRQ